MRHFEHGPYGEIERELCHPTHQAGIAKFNNCPVLSINGSTGQYILYMGTDEHGGFEIGTFKLQRDAKSYARAMAEGEPLFIKQMFLERGIKDGAFNYVPFT